MASSFSFGGINTKDKKRSLNQDLVDSPIIVDRSDTPSTKFKAPVVVLVERFYKGKEVEAIENWLRKNGLKKYIIMCPLKYDVTPDYIQEELHEGVIGYYIRNVNQFRKFIPSLSPILVAGQAIYSLLQEDDVQFNHADQRPFCVTNFWFSYDLTSNGNYVYPIWSVSDIFADGFIDNTGRIKNAVDSYRTNLALLQINDIIKAGTKYPPRYPRLNKVFIESKEEFYSKFYEPNKDRKGELLAWDLETSGLNFYTDEIGCITLSFNGTTGYYIPWKYVDKECLNEILLNNRNLGHNLKFDLKHVRRQGLSDKIKIDEDTYILAHLMDETRGNSLKAMAFYYSPFGGYERALDVYKQKYNIENYLDIDEDILKEYAIMDAIVCRRIYDKMIEHVRWLDKKYPNELYPSNTLEEFYYYRLIPVVNMYAKVEYNGFCVNKAKLDKLRIEMRDYITNLKKELCNLYNVEDDFDWGSTTKVGKLFKKIGYENLGETKAGEYKCSDDELVRWAKIHPEVKKLQELRSINTLINTFVGDEEGTKGWPQYMVHHPEDKPEVYRMHATFNSMGTESFRSRCNSPNLQNLPGRSTWASAIKKCVCTPDDDKYYLGIVDFANLQLRISCAMSQDPNLTAAFTTPGNDPHSSTGYLVFANGRELDIETIEVEQDGKIYKFLGGEHVETKRGEIFARDLKEDDELII